MDCLVKLFRLSENRSCFSSQYYTNKNAEFAEFGPNLLCPENLGVYLHETLVEAQIVPDGVLPALVGLQLVVGELLLDPLVDVGQGCLDSSLRGSINGGNKYEVFLAK